MSAPVTRALFQRDAAPVRSEARARRTGLRSRDAEGAVQAAPRAAALRQPLPARTVSTGSGRTGEGPRSAKAISGVVAVDPARGEGHLGAVRDAAAARDALLGKAHERHGAKEPLKEVHVVGVTLAGEAPDLGALGVDRAARRRAAAVDALAVAVHPVADRGEDLLALAGEAPRARRAPRSG